MGYIGAGPTRFNTADELTVTGDAEFNGDLTVKGTHITLDSATVQTVDLGDNDKIRLGDSDDLQIYHDGSDSYITEGGTGSLYIGADSTIALTDAAVTQNKAQFITGGAVNLFHNNALKFATTATGVDVTGTVTADGLTMGDGHTLALGDSSEFTISHTSGGNTNIAESGSGNLNISARDLVIQDVAGTSRLKVDGNLGDISFYEDTGTSAKFFWDASAEALGIGTVPDSPLEIRTAANSSSDTTYLKLSNLGENVGHIDFENGNGDLARITGTKEGSGASGDDGILVFSTALNASLAEAMRITSGGGVAIGTSSPISDVMLDILPKSTSRIINTRSYNTSFQYHHVFQNNSGSTVGSIGVSTTATTYAVSSDYRLKTAVTYDWDATTRLKQLRPARFEWIVDGDDAVPVDGFLAHEVQDIVPEAITGTHNGMRDEEYEVTPAVLDDDGNEVTPAVMGTRSVPDYQGIDQSKLVPLLVKTIQELEARIVALETA